MALSNNVFVRLPNFQIFHRYIPKPSLYIKQNQAHLIIATHTWESKYLPDGMTDMMNLVGPGIYEYNIETNKMKRISKYNPNYFKPTLHGQCYDSVNNNVYIFSGDFSSKYVALLNLKMQNMTIEYNKQKWIGAFSSSIFISSGNNDQIHVIRPCRHLIFDVNKNTVIQSKITKLNVFSPKLLFIPLKQQLIILGSSNRDNIFICDISSQQEDYKWKRHTLKMPRVCRTRYYDVLLAFTHLIFVFYSTFDGFSDIYCMDINTNIWYKSEYETPKSCDYVFKGINNAIHLFDFNQGYHFKANLSELIPTDLCNIYSEQYKPLIFGFILDQEKRNIIPTIPFVIKQLIWRYYPSFI